MRRIATGFSTPHCGSILGSGLLALVISGAIAAAAPLVCRTPADASLFWKLSYPGHQHRP